MKKIILISLTLLGCQKSADGVTSNTKYCTVEKLESVATITCPNGTKITVPPEIITKEIEIIKEVPVTVDTPKNCKKKDPQPDHGNDDEHGHSNGEE